LLNIKQIIVLCIAKAKHGIKLGIYNFELTGMPAKTAHNKCILTAGAKTQMIEISQKGLIITDEAQVDALQREFAEKSCVILPRLLEAHLLEKLLLAVDKANFEQQKHIDHNEKIFGTDLSIQNRNLALHQVHFLLNNPQLFKLVEKITQCKPINGFAGRIYKNMPNTDHKLDWHDDTEDKSRIIAVSMNLSREKFEGGVFQIRVKGSDEYLREVPCGNTGDMHIFKVSPQLQHRVKATTGDFPRTAAAGWFTDEPYTGLKF
jgi:hypothetical protein